MKKSFSNRIKSSVALLALTVMILATPISAFASSPFITIPVDMSAVVYNAVEAAGMGKLKIPTTFMLTDTYTETGYAYNMYEDSAAGSLGYRVVTLEYLSGKNVDVEKSAKELYKSISTSVDGYISNPYYAEPTMIKCGDKEVWILSLWFYVQNYYEYNSWILLEGPEGLYMISINDTVPQVPEVKSIYDEIIDSVLAFSDAKNVGNQAYTKFLNTFDLW